MAVEDTAAVVVAVEAVADIVENSAAEGIADNSNAIVECYNHSSTYTEDIASFVAAALVSSGFLFQQTL